MKSIEREEALASRKREREKKLGQEGLNEMTGQLGEGVKVDEEAFIIPIASIDIEDQARKTFEGISELGESIKVRGQINAVVVKKLDNGRFLLVDGERRLRAIRDHLRAKTIRGTLWKPSLEKSDVTADIRMLQLIANKQRADYPPMELAIELQRMKDEDGYTDEQLADNLGMARSTVTKMRSLLNAPESIQEKIRDGRVAVSTYLNTKTTMIEESKRSRKAFLKLDFKDAIKVARFVEKISAEKGSALSEPLGDKPTKKGVASILTQGLSELLLVLEKEAGEK